MSKNLSDETMVRLASRIAAKEQLSGEDMAALREIRTEGDLRGKFAACCLLAGMLHPGAEPESERSGVLLALFRLDGRMQQIFEPGDPCRFVPVPAGTMRGAKKDRNYEKLVDVKDAGTAVLYNRKTGELSCRMHVEPDPEKVYLLYVSIPKEQLPCGNFQKEETCIRMEQSGDTAFARVQGVPSCAEYALESAMRPRTEHTRKIQALYEAALRDPEQLQTLFETITPDLKATVKYTFQGFSEAGDDHLIENIASDAVHAMYQNILAGTYCYDFAAYANRTARKMAVSYGDRRKKERNDLDWYGYHEPESLVGDRDIPYQNAGEEKQVRYCRQQLLLSCVRILFEGEAIPALVYYYATIRYILSRLDEEKREDTRRRTRRSVKTRSISFAQTQMLGRTWGELSDLAIAECQDRLHCRIPVSGTYRDSLDECCSDDVPGDAAFWKKMYRMCDARPDQLVREAAKRFGQDEELKEVCRTLRDDIPMVDNICRTAGKLEQRGAVR